MSKDEITKKYNALVASIEEAGIYDGRGVYNLYECNKCSNSKVTLYIDKGVTPFIIACDECDGHMSHTKTSRCAPLGGIVHCWVRPSLEQTLKLSEGLQEHVLNGGLVLREDLNNETDTPMKRSHDEDALYFDNPIHYDNAVDNQYYKGSSTKAGSSRKEIAKRRKKNKNNKTHRRQ